MLLSYSGLLTPQLCRAHPLNVFLFGDNTWRAGEAGQANIRREFNVFGVPTKRYPGMDPSLDFFEDGNPEDQTAVVTAIIMVQALAKEIDVVVPVNPDGSCSLGCGLSELPARAPKLYAFICEQLKPTGEFRG